MFRRASIAMVLCVVVGFSPVWAAVWKDCSQVRSGLPLPTYERDHEHHMAGLTAASRIAPRLWDGRVDPAWKTGSTTFAGKVVVIEFGNGIGRPIAGAFHQAFKPYQKPWIHLANLNTNLMGTEEWGNPFFTVWTKTSLYLSNRGLWPNQVQAAIGYLSQTDPDHPTTAAEIAQVVRTLKEKFKLITVVYLVDMPYQGYSTRPGGGHNPWPNVVHEAHQMAALATTQAGLSDVWVEYLPISADGVDPNPYAGDLAYPCTFVADDGSKPSPLGAAAIAVSLVERLRQDDVTFGWLR